MSKNMEKGLTYLLREKSNNDLIVATYKGNKKISLFNCIISILLVLVIIYKF